MKELKFSGIALGITFTALLFPLHSCKGERTSVDRPGSLGISSNDMQASWSPDGKKIVFYSYRDGNFEIYSMNADGSRQTRLTDNPAADTEPAWSPDGQRIAFVSDRDGNREIYVMNPDGTDQARLTSNSADDGEPAWSPDGKKIVFHSDRDGNAEIYIMNRDGSDPTRLTDDPKNDGLPSWSPDGTRIVFASRRDGNPEIYIMNADGSEQIRLTDNPAKERYPSWKPDGSRIIFDSDRDGLRDVYAMNTDGSNLTRLTDNPAYDGLPCWSPDGRKIAFNSDRDFVDEVYLMNPDGSNQVNLTNNAPLDITFGLTPLPQSELNLEKIPYSIVFESFRETEGKENWEICLINADGSNFINLTNTPEIYEMYPHASPDGRRICFEAVEGESQEVKSRNVYIMNIDGTQREKIADNANQPCWSPDGKYIAYLPGEFPRYNPYMLANKGLEIYDLETGKAKRHPNDKITHRFGLCWSPDEEWLVTAGMKGIKAYKTDDNTIVPLSAPGCTPDISPDGKRLVWNSSDFNLIIGRLSFDSPQNNVTEHKVVVASEHEYWVYHADWSPDSRYLTFSYMPDDAHNFVGMPAPGSNICICDLKTGKWTLITTDGKHNKEPDWVPVQEEK